MMNRVAPPEQNGNGLSMLAWMEPSEIAAIIAPEHPQIAALVLSHLNPDLAAETIALLPELDQEEILFRLATLGPVPQAAIDALEPILLRAQNRPAVSAKSQRGGTSDVAAILNNLAKPAETRILKSVQKRDKGIASAIEDEMFIFDDLAALDDRTLGTILRGADSSLLVPALKGAEAGLRARMLGAMSKRAAETISDEIAERGPMPRADVIAAQRGIIQVAKQMADEGSIQLGNKGDDLV
jgi:flagellar motor switch protein FliG